MPPICRLGDTASGHDECAITQTTTSSNNTYANGLGVCRKGDNADIHSCTVHRPHIRTIFSGSSSVLTNSKPTAMLGGTIDCGGCLITGSGNVIAGG